MALNGLFCADVPLRNYSLTHSLKRGGMQSVGLFRDDIYCSDTSMDQGKAN